MSFRKNASTYVIVAVLLFVVLQFNRPMACRCPPNKPDCPAVVPTLRAKAAETVPTPSTTTEAPETQVPTKTRKSKRRTPAPETAEDDVGAGNGAPSSGDDCYATTKKSFDAYAAYAERGAALRKEHGPLKVLAFSRLWVPPLHGTGGMQYHALHLYSTLASQGHLVHVLVTGGPNGHRKLHFDVDTATLELKAARDESKARLTVHQVPSDKNGEYSENWHDNLLVAAKELNDTVGGFDVAHSESWAGVPNAYLLGLPMAVTWHGSMLDWFRNEMNLIVHNFRMKGKMPGNHITDRMKSLGGSVAYETYMLLTVPHHIVISDSAADDLKEMNLVEPHRVHLIYNGVNPSNFKPDPSARQPFLEKHGVHDSGSAFVVGCGGRLEGIKGHHQLATAMEKVLKAHKDVVLLVAGSGGESTRYETLKSKGLRVILLGMMKQADLARFYQSLDCFVDPFYQHHGLNTVMIEATLSGVPLIATGLASSKTTVPCDAFGRSFGLGMADELASKIVELYKNPTARAEISKNVRERSLKLFTSHGMAGAYEAVLYDALLKPMPMIPITGKVVCRHTYPAMCYREPS